MSKKIKIVLRVLLAAVLIPASVIFLNYGAKRSFDSKYATMLSQMAKVKGLEFANGISSQITLATQMAKTVSIVEYMRDPTDSEKASRALSEFSAYQNTFLGKNIYYANAIDMNFYTDCKFSYHVDVSNPDHSWWQKTMYATPIFNFTVSYNPELGRTSLGINVPVRYYNTAIGMCGSQVPLNTYTDRTFADIKGSGIDLYFYNDSFEITTALDSSLVERHAAIPSVLTGLEASQFLVGGEETIYSNSSGIYAIYPLTDIGWNLVVFKSYGFIDFISNIAMPVLILLLLAFNIATIVVVRRALQPLRAMNGVIQAMASGDADLSRRMDSPKAGTMSLIVRMVMGFNQFMSNLQEIVESVKGSDNELIASGNDLNEGIQKTSNATAKIVASVGEFSKAIENQTTSVSEASGAVNQISANIESLSHMISTQAQSVDSASSAVEEMVGNIQSVNKSVETLAESFDKLESESAAGISVQEQVNAKIIEIDKQSKMLQEANKVISSIASQTNLLAMNAAIEAAHAGEAGRGFSVVADEIRKLSETSAGQSKTIGFQLKQIQRSIGSIVEDSAKSKATYVNVTDKINQTSTLVQQISAAMEEQESGSKQIVEALSVLNDATHEVRTSSGEMAAGSRTILDQMRNLQDATVVMREGMKEITTDTDEIQENQYQLNKYSKEMNDSIDSIGDRLSQFK